MEKLHTSMGSHGGKPWISRSDDGDALLSFPMALLGINLVVMRGKKLVLARVAIGSLGIALLN